MAVDTLKIYERLKSHAMPDAAARELAEVLKENIEETHADLATKKDIETLRKEMAEMKYDIIKWLVALLVIQTVAARLLH
ncbi:MAG: hypothetical protein HZA04_02735 [Nitrospinae bacterium]|nr:hypothetical protein [Nitrospinota bacterium]